jgi:hypothetical protein
MEKQLEQFLQELYQFDPRLKQFDHDLRTIIREMSIIRPDTKFSPELAERIKDRLMAQIKIEERSLTKNSYFKFNFINMNKKLYIYGGVAAVFIFALVAINMNLTKVQDESKISSQPNYYQDWVEQNQDAVVRLEAGAFGSLASVSSGEGQFGKMESMSADSVSSLAPLGLGGDTVAMPEPMMGGGGVDAKMIMPYFNFKYVYQGDEIDLSDRQGDVYKRLTASSGGTDSLISLVSGLNLNGLSLSSFSNLQMQNLSLMEDKDKGLSISFDFVSGTVSIYENWQKWRLPERENCAGDQDCWNRWRLQMSDVPQDNALITWANSFVNKHQIDVSAYGEPVVDNLWKNEYARSEDKANFYIPEYASVVYPYLVDGQAVRDQGGNYAGLRVSVNLIHKAVSGVSNLSLNRYEASVYPLVTDFQRVVRQAENGGWNGSYFYSSEDVQEIALGTPEKIYVQIWNYSNNRSDELMIPALLFPVLENDSVSSNQYYGQRFVIVPLVNDIFSELEGRQNNVIDGGVEIMPYPTPMLR